MARSVLSTLKVRQYQGALRPTQIQAVIADSFFSRLVGLLSRKSLNDAQGLLLVPCASIHTFGMRFAIDVVFLDDHNKVLGFADNVVPNRVRAAPKGTEKVLEIAQGNRIRTGIHLDDYLIFD